MAEQAEQHGEDKRLHDLADAIEIAILSEHSGISSDGASPEVLELLEAIVAPTEEDEETGEDPISAPPSIWRDQQRAPFELEGYDILEKIPGGGMGAVFKARQHSLDRTVAIKVIKNPALATPESFRRFEREAKALAKVEHPGVCEIYEVNEKHGLPYIVMEFVEGTTLADHLSAGTVGDLFICLNSEAITEHSTPTWPTEPVEDRGTQPGERDLWPELPRTRDKILNVVSLMEHVARAVQVAHDQAVIHRDLKPSNIIVQPSGAPKVIDFGLALDLESDSERDTNEGARLGTARYMAPEQVEGRVKDIDEKTDVYALGVTLYELLTAGCPFEGPTREAVYAKILRGIIVDPRRHNPAIPRDLSAVCLKAFDVARERRYSTAEALADDLRCVLEGRPTHARPLSPFQRLWRFARRHPAPSLAVAAAMILALVVGVFWLQRVSLGRTVGLSQFYLAWQECVEHAQSQDRADFTEDERRRLEGLAEGDRDALILLGDFTNPATARRLRQRILDAERSAASNSRTTGAWLPRGTIVGGRPTFRFAPPASLEGSLALLLVRAEGGRAVETLPPIPVSASGEPGGTQVTLSLPEGWKLPPGEYEWFLVHLNDAPGDLNPPEAVSGSVAFRVAAAEERERLLQPLAPLPDSARRRFLEATALFSGGFMMDARDALDGVSFPDNRHLALRLRVLRGAIDRFFGDIESLREALSFVRASMTTPAARQTKEKD